jgi:hypothetical protein
MNTDELRSIKMGQVQRSINKKSSLARKWFGSSIIQRSILVSSVFICVHLWPINSVFAEQTTPVVDTALDKAAKELEKAKEETQKLKDAWDRTRLETTLYDQRAKRAYRRWLKAGKSLKEQAKGQKEKAELELQLAIEKRKLAWSRWQEAQYDQMAAESSLKAVDQKKDKADIEKKIREIESKLSGPESAKPTGTP